MKKKVIPVLLFLLLQISFCRAQNDTIVLRNGQKIGAKVISVSGFVIYSIPPSEKKLYFGRSKVNYIKYKDGSIYTIKHNKDSIKLKTYVAISGGASFPIFQGYGGHLYNNDPEEGEYSGFANNGTAFAITAGLKIYNGWELTGMLSYIRNSFDATGFMSETADMDIFNIQTLGFTTSDIKAIGSYVYTNYSYLIGVTKSWKDKLGGVGFSLMIGDFIEYEPALHGIEETSYSFYSNGITYNTNLGDEFNMNSETKKNLVLELNIHGDINITQHIFLRALVELEFTGITNSGGYQVIDPAYTFSGVYSGANSYYPSQYNISLANAMLGIGYKL